MATFYKVTLNGQVDGKDHMNTLYYKADLGAAGGDFGFGGAAELAEEVLQEIVPAYLDAHPTNYTLQTIDVEPRNDVFELLYQLPYRLRVQQPGMQAHPTGFDSPALCANIRFNLEPQLIGLQAVSAPKRGYIAVGPLPSVWLDDDGKLSDVIFFDAESRLNILAGKLSQNLESIDPPSLWSPIRVAQKYGAAGGAGLTWGWAGVSSATVNEYSSYRRSRRVRG